MLSPLEFLTQKVNPRQTWTSPLALNRNLARSKSSEQEDIRSQVVLKIYVMGATGSVHARAEGNPFNPRGGVYERGTQV